MAEPLTDRKAAFYLQNRDDIEEWAGLRDEARVVVERHLLTRVDDVLTFAVDQGAEVYSKDLDGGAYPRADLTRRAWRHAGLLDLAVVIGWQTSALLVPWRENEWPYVGVRISYKQKDQDRRTRVSEKLSRLQAWGYHSSRVSNAWPLWASVTSPGACGVDPAVLADNGILRLQQLWSEAAPILDALH